MKESPSRLPLIIIMLVVLTPLVAMIVGGASMCQFVSSITDRFTATPVIQPTPTDIIRTGPLVINAVRSQAKLQTVVMNIVGDQDVTRVSGISGLCTEHITYLAYYDVTAGVDLAKINEDNIVVTDDGLLDKAVVTIIVPPAEILNVTLDTEHSRVVAQDTPTWIPGCETQVADMALEAQQRLREYAGWAAIDQGILQSAQERAGFELQRLLLETGYQNVTIEYAQPEQAP
jgi:hypothetical protein